MTENIIRKLKRLSALALVLAIISLSACNSENTDSNSVSKTESAIKNADFSYDLCNKVFYNPLCGFAPQADYTAAVGENTLVYVEVLWKDIEPSEGVYDFSKLEEEKQLERWKKEGKHAVMRFICDKPSDIAHMDIPKWLYDKTGDGTKYAYDSTHMGYSPDYSNPVFIAAHEKAIKALGEHFGKDGFVSYVELGSLGHWGEWHVNYESGIVRMPKEEIREQYVTPYISAFPNAKFLMRRPFNTAAKYGFGLYDDTAGNPTATAEWLKWIARGGDYNQANEKNALTPMPEAWKTAPIGGEFNSDISLVSMITTGLNTTLSLLKESHTTFLGPHFPNGLRSDTGKDNKDGIDAVRKMLGYRLAVKKASLRINSDDTAEITLDWTNDGNAPMYFDWNVYLYFYNGDKKLTGKWPVEMKLTEILPGSLVSVTAEVSTAFLNTAEYVCIGIEDPMTNLPAVHLTMEAEEIELTSLLFKTFDVTY